MTDLDPDDVLVDLGERVRLLPWIGSEHRPRHRYNPPESIADLRPGLVLDVRARLIEQWQRTPARSPQHSTGRAFTLEPERDAACWSARRKLLDRMNEWRSAQ